MSNKKEYELAVRIAGILDSSLDKSVLHTKRQLRSIANEAVKASAMSQPVSLAESIKNMDPVINGAWKGLTKVAKVGVAAMAAAGAAAVAAGKQAVDVGSEFEKAMSSWKATANATETEYNIARDAAMETGRTTTKTATESANALEYMALAGWNVQDSVKALPGVLHLSESTGLELAETSSLVTDSMAALGIQMDSTGKDFNHYLDVAAKANNSSNQTAEQLMTAYIKTGGVLKSLRIPVEESAAAFGIMANRGLKAEEAGTAMRAVLINLTTGAGKAGKMMDKLGISAFDSQGNFKGLKAVLEEVNQKTKDMTEEERNAAYSALGGKLHIAALTDLMDGLNSKTKEGVSEWDNLQTSLENSNGALEKMAATKMDNLWGDMKILQSALQDTGIRIYDGLTDPLRDATQWFTKLIYKSGDLADSVKEQYPTVRRIILDGAKGVKEFAEPLIEFGKAFVLNPAGLGSIQFLVQTIAGMKALSTGVHALDAVKKFALALGGSPGAAIAAGLVAVASGIVSIYTAYKRMEKINADNNLADHFGNLTLSLRELDDAAKQIIGTDAVDILEYFTDQMNELETQGTSLKSVTASIDKIQLKIKNGFELSDEDKQTLADSITQFINDSLNIVDQGGYTGQQSITALFGSNDLLGRAIVGEFTNTFNSIHDDMADLGRQLGEVYSSAMEDGVLDPSKLNIDTAIQLEQKMQEINNRILQAKSKAALQALSFDAGENGLSADSFKNLEQKIGEQTDSMMEGYNDARQTALAAAELGLENGTYDQGTYERRVQQIEEQYRNKKTEVKMSGINYETGAILQHYNGESNDFNSNFRDGLSQDIIDAMQTAADTAENLEGTTGNDVAISMIPEKLKASIVNGIKMPSKDTQDAIKQLLKEMEPQISDMDATYESYKQAGKKIPQSLQDGINEVGYLKAMSGDEDALLEFVGKKIGSDDNYKELIKKMKENGKDIPDALMKGIEESDDLSVSTEHFRKKVEEALDDSFSKPFDLDADVNLNFKPNVFNTGLTARILGGDTGNEPKIHVRPRATGGIVSSPQLNLIGEAGYPEAIIPINQSQRAASLYEQTGALLQSAGNTVNSDNSSRSITFAPNINIAGNASQSEVMSATRASFDEFKRMMAQYERENVRLAL